MSMARVAVRNTYAIERIYDSGGSSVDVRRLVIAGLDIPDHWIIDPSALAPPPEPVHLTRRARQPAPRASGRRQA